MDTYDVIVLGARGSGKTVFLASMYHRLSVQEETTRFFLYASPSQKKLLLANYDEIANSTRPWPEATNRQQVPEYSFICRVRTPDQKIHDAFQFNYWDYSGGHLTDPNTGAEAQLFKSAIEDRFHKAHALLGILDGQKVLAFLRNEQIAAGSIASDINYILPELENNPNPVHFVITKWDLFEGEFTFGMVRERLLQIPRFKSFVEQRRLAELPVRMIPVSSVGMSFAEPRIEDGVVTMIKRPGALPHPFQVEMPLACVIPDKLVQELKKLKEEEDQARRRSVEVAPKLSLWNWLGSIVGGAVEIVRNRLPRELRLAKPLLDRLAEAALAGKRLKEADAHAASERLRQEREESIKAVIDQQSAVTHVLTNFAGLIETLEMKFPDSNMSRL